MTNASGRFVKILKENQRRKRKPRGSFDFILEFVKHADEAEEFEEFFNYNNIYFCAIKLLI